MRDILFKLRKRVYDGRIYSGTYDEEHPWEKYLPKHMVNYMLNGGDFPEDNLIDAMCTQEKRKTIAEKYKKEAVNTMYVFEDLEFMKPSLFNCEPIRTIAFNGRWKRCFGLFAIQYIMEIKMAIRGMFDYAFFSFESSNKVRDRIYTNFFGCIESRKMFDDIFQECTKNFGVIVVDLRSRSYKIEDNVFWYRASDHKQFRVGVPEIWVERPLRVDERERLALKRIESRVKLIKKSNGQKKTKKK